MPEEVVVRVTAPTVAGLTPRQVMDEVYRLARQKRDEVRARVALSGRRFLGRRGVLRQDPNAAASTPETAVRLRPRYATDDRELRLELILRDSDWLVAHRLALNLFRAGDRNAIFPHATFQAVEDYRLDCILDPG